MKSMYEMLRLICTTDLSVREIGMSSGYPKTTVHRYSALVDAKGLTWADLKSLSDADLDSTFNSKAHRKKNVQLNFANIQMQLAATGKTLWRWWNEWTQTASGETYSYQHLAKKCKKYGVTQSRSMLQRHRPGAGCFVDFSGDRPWYFDRKTGKKVTVELFVATLGYSSYSFAYCTPSQKIADWIDANVRMLEFFGGVPSAIVPDNLLAAVTKPGKNPIIQQEYSDLAAHYDTAIVPARPRRPKDKAKVEAHVNVFQNEFLPVVRERKFYSLDELNAELARVVARVNARNRQKLGTSRLKMFEETERPALKPLPCVRFRLLKWHREQKVPSTYHLWVDRHLYSVPHQYVNARLVPRVGEKEVEFFDGRVRVARHPLSTEAGGITTDPAHMTDAHREYSVRAPAQLLKWAERVGLHTLAVFKTLLNGSVEHLALQKCQVLRDLGEERGVEKMEQACETALARKRVTVDMVKRLVVESRTDSPSKRMRRTSGTASSSSRCLRHRNSPSRLNGCQTTGLLPQPAWASMKRGEVNRREGE